MLLEVLDLDCALQLISKFNIKPRIYIIYTYIFFIFYLVIFSEHRLPGIKSGRWPGLQALTHTGFAYAFPCSGVQEPTQYIPAGIFTIIRSYTAYTCTVLANPSYELVAVTLQIRKYVYHVPLLYRVLCTSAVSCTSAVPCTVYLCCTVYCVPLLYRVLCTSAVPCTVYCVPLLYRIPLLYLLKCAPCMCAKIHATWFQPLPSLAQSK